MSLYQRIRLEVTNVRKHFALIVLASSCAFAAGGTCPTGANYIDLSNPSNGGGNGSVTLSSLGVTSCFYIAATGLDTNTGIDEAHPWLHAPGMPSCASTCLATTPTSNEGFIFRGGDTWHRSSGTPGIGGVWTWGQSGSSLANPIYIGVDFTWFAGASFARPILSFDNALSTSTVASCNVANDDGLTLVNFASQSNVIFDAFDLTGQCSTGSSGSQYIGVGTAVVTERWYCHGWTLTATATDDIVHCVGPQGNGVGNRHIFTVSDGSDSTFGTTCTLTSCVRNGGSFVTNGATGYAFIEGYDVEFSVIRHVSNGIEANNIGIVRDDLFEFIFEPSFGGRHGNVTEALGGANTPTCQIYNSVFRNINEGVVNWPQCNTQFWFNNVFENVGQGANPNCIILSPQGSSNVGVVTTVSMANNTADGTCAAQAFGGNAGTPHWAAGSAITIQNMHILDRTSLFGASNFFVCSSGSTCTTETDSGGEVFQTTAVANGQGYTQSNDFAPTASNNSTVHAGNNISASCSTFSADQELCSGTSKGVTEVSAWGGQMASSPAVTVNSRGTTWDSGAYQFSAGTPAALPPAPWIFADMPAPVPAVPFIAEMRPPY